MLLAGAGASVLAACHRKPAPATPGAAPAPAGTHDLAWAVNGDWRSHADRKRDEYRHPLESLTFWGLKPGMTVVELWPGAGWYTDIIAPFLAASGGTLYEAEFQPTPGAGPELAAAVAAFEQKVNAKPRLYGHVNITAFGPTSGPMAPAGSADLVLFLRNLHNWMAGGIAEKAFHDAYEALKPGGVLGIEEHRASEGGVQDVLATNGYVQQAYVIKMAQEAGFVLDKTSEINANPKDGKDHPFGVWTLPPTRLTAPRGEPAVDGFDHSKYDAIGESDRMTLRFTKPK